MRELKLRAWGRDIKKFLYIELKPNAQIKDSEWRYNEYDDWEQYTGLKDKNGKKIYEGDIAKADGRIYEVAWFEKDGGWFCFRENDSVYTPLYHLKGEVIGNIHENPELLEGGK